MVDYLSLISKYTQEEHEQTVPAFIIHSTLVTQKALQIARSYTEHTGEEIDLQLLEEMGMLHDIGIFRTKEPVLFTTGDGPYITHLHHGSEILKKEGLELHARAARTHASISLDEIKEQNLPLPDKGYVPETSEEEILHIADQFFSKNFKHLFDERTHKQVLEYLNQYPTKKKRFISLFNKYCEH
jgi:uncharacterized protein